MESESRTVLQKGLLVVLLLFFGWNFYACYNGANQLKQINKFLETKEAAHGLASFSLATHDELAETIRNQWSRTLSPACAEEKQSLIECARAYVELDNKFIAQYSVAFLWFAGPHPSTGGCPGFTPQGW